MCTKLNFYSTWPQSFANLISHIGATKKNGPRHSFDMDHKGPKPSRFDQAARFARLQAVSGMLVHAAIRPVALRRPASQTTLVKRPTLGLWN